MENISVSVCVCTLLKILLMQRSSTNPANTVTYQSHTHSAWGGGLTHTHTLNPAEEDSSRWNLSQEGGLEEL